MNDSAVSSVIGSHGALFPPGSATADAPGGTLADDGTSLAFTTLAAAAAPSAAPAPLQMRVLEPLRVGVSGPALA